VGGVVSRALEISAIEKIVQKFIEAGDRAARAGFDAVEIHAAHGYLLHHFIDRVTNRRSDAYGGELKGRYRILGEIGSGLRSKHPTLPIIVRLSLREDDDVAAIAKVIEKFNFDAIDVRSGFSSMPALETGKSPAQGYTLSLAQNLRTHSRKPVMTGGRILTVAQAEYAIMSGLDAVVLGRPLLADPDWAIKAKSGQSISLCLYDCDPSCYSRFKEGEELRCVYYDRRE
jgi:2,4-dienoyl-CoA reductase-like NADH-dependent reductase (Old Yellow Enzyme family)